MSREWCLYVFDSTPMILVMITWNVFHPSEVRSLLRGGFAFKGFKGHRIEKLEV
jgi:hypothetical protein